MSAKLIIAVPSKGRIMEGTYEFFFDAGLGIARPATAREYVGALKGVAGGEVVFMSSGEIAAGLAGGSIHVGVTGEDLLRETAADLDARVALVKPLNFGFADVVVAVPRSWIDVASMSDLDDLSDDFRQRHGRPLRVATKYLSLTRRFFAAHGITDYRIVASSGATEGAPASGIAELIVDITTTGATLHANNLKVLSDGVILKSQAQLAVSLTAKWTKSRRAALAHVLDRIAARDAAKDRYVISFQLAKRAPRLLAALEDAGCAVAHPPPGAGEIQCPERAMYDAVDLLRGAGATGITVRRAAYLFDAGNPLFDALADRLK